MSPWNSVVNRAREGLGGSGATHSGKSRIPRSVSGFAYPVRELGAANDNPAPLRERLRRTAFLAGAALAVGWLFWTGFLR